MTLLDSLTAILKFPGTNLTQRPPFFLPGVVDADVVPAPGITQWAVTGTTVQGVHQLRITNTGKTPLLSVSLRARIMTGQNILADYSKMVGSITPGNATIVSVPFIAQVDAVTLAVAMANGSMPISSKVTIESLGLFNKSFQMVSSMPVARATTPAAAPLPVPAPTAVPAPVARATTPAVAPLPQPVPALPLTAEMAAGRRVRWAVQDQDGNEYAYQGTAMGPGSAPGYWTVLTTSAPFAVEMGRSIDVLRSVLSPLGQESPEALAAAMALATRAPRPTATPQAVRVPVVLPGGQVVYVDSQQAAVALVGSFSRAPVSPGTPPAQGAALIPSLIPPANPKLGAVWKDAATGSTYTYDAAGWGTADRPLLNAPGAQRIDPFLTTAAQLEAQRQAAARAQAATTLAQEAAAPPSPTAGLTQAQAEAQQQAYLARLRAGLAPIVPTSSAVATHKSSTSPALPAYTTTYVYDPVVGEVVEGPPLLTSPSPPLLVPTLSAGDPTLSPGPPLRPPSPDLTSAFQPELPQGRPTPADRAPPGPPVAPPLPSIAAAVGTAASPVRLLDGSASTLPLPPAGPDPLATWQSEQTRLGLQTASPPSTVVQQYNAWVADLLPAGDPGAQGPFLTGPSRSIEDLFPPPQSGAPAVSPAPLSGQGQDLADLAALYKGKLLSETDYRAAYQGLIGGKSLTDLGLPSGMPPSFLTLLTSAALRQTLIHVALTDGASKEIILNARVLPTFFTSRLFATEVSLERPVSPEVFRQMQRLADAYNNGRPLTPSLDVTRVLPTGGSFPSAAAGPTVPSALNPPTAAPQPRMGGALSFSPSTEDVLPAERPPYLGLDPAAQAQVDALLARSQHTAGVADPYVTPPTLGLPAAVQTVTALFRISPRSVRSAGVRLFQGGAQQAAYDSGARAVGEIFAASLPTGPTLLQVYPDAPQNTQIQFRQTSYDVTVTPTGYSVQEVSQFTGQVAPTITVCPSEAGTKTAIRQALDDARSKGLLGLPFSAASPLPADLATMWRGGNFSLGTDANGNDYVVVTVPENWSLYVLVNAGTYTLYQTLLFQLPECRPTTPVSAEVPRSLVGIL